MNEILLYLLCATGGAFIATLVKSNDRSNGRVEGYCRGVEDGARFERYMIFKWIDTHPTVNELKEIRLAIHKDEHHKEAIK